MKKTIITFFLFLLCSISYAQKNEELTKVRANLSAWLTSFNNKDAKTLYSLYDPESIYANANSPLMVGLDQIKPWYNQVLPAVKGSVLFKEEQNIIEGNMAILIGKYYFAPQKGEATVGIAGRVALVYRKNNAGKWLLLFDMDNNPPDATPNDFK